MNRCNTLAKEAPAILIDVLGAIIAFFLGAILWKFSGRKFDKDAAIFWAKVYGGLCLFGIIMDFVM
jgi:hypothetical protein